MLKQLGFIIIIGMLSLNASSLAYAKNYDEAKKMALVQKKKIMVLVTTKVCPWCHKFKTETLTDTKIVNVLNKDFVVVNIDRDNDTYPKIFRTRLVPTTFFVDPNSEKMLTKAPAVGYYNSEDFNDYLVEATTKR